MELCVFWYNRLTMTDQLTFNKTFSNFCYESKVHLNLSKKDIAEILVTSQNNISRWCKNVTPQYKSLDRLKLSLHTFKKEHYKLMVLQPSFKLSVEQLLRKINLIITLYEEKQDKSKEHRNLTADEKENFTNNFNRLIEYMNDFALIGTKAQTSESQSSNSINYLAELNSLNNGLQDNKRKKLAIQTVLGKLIGVSKTQISLWKAGKAFPDYQSRSKLEKVIYPISMYAFLNRQYKKNDFSEIFIDSYKLSNAIQEFVAEYQEKLFKISKIVSKYHPSSALEIEEVDSNFEELIEEYLYRYFCSTLLLLNSAYKTVHNHIDEFDTFLKNKINSNNFKIMFKGVPLPKKSKIKQVKYMSKVLINCYGTLTSNPEFILEDWNLIIFVNENKRFFERFKKEFPNINKEKFYSAKSLYFDPFMFKENSSGFNDLLLLINEYKILSKFFIEGEPSYVTTEDIFFRDVIGFDEEFLSEKLQGYFDDFWQIIQLYDYSYSRDFEPFEIEPIVFFLHDNKNLYQEILKEYRHSKLFNLDSAYSSVLLEWYNKIK